MDIIILSLIKIVKDKIKDNTLKDKKSYGHQKGQPANLTTSFIW